MVSLIDWVPLLPVGGEKAVVPSFPVLVRTGEPGREYAVCRWDGSVWRLCSASAHVVYGVTDFAEIGDE